MKKAKSKPKLSAREQVLLLALPAALVAMIYAFTVNPKHIAALTRTTTSLKRAREKDNTQSIVLSGAALDRENRRLAAEKAALQQQLDAFNGGDATSTQRTEAMVSLSALLRRHGLIVLAEGPSAGGATAAMGRRGPQATPAPNAADRVWEIRFLGPWNNVQSALVDLRTFNALCFPVNLTMAEPKPGVETRDWTLRLRL
jgi:hypothetical protein